MTDKKIYIDNQFKPAGEAKVSVFDHGLLYGDGVFEGIRAYGGKAFRLKAHLERLVKSGRMISLEIPWSIEKLSALVDEALKINNLSDAYIRLIVTRGVGDLGLDPRKCSNPNLIIIADQVALFPERCYQEGLEAAIVKTQRNLTQALNPAIKSLNYLNSVLAKIEANEKNVPEAIMLNHDGFISECSGDNVFYIKAGKVITPPTGAGILEGITREAVIEIIRTQTKHPFAEVFFKPHELLAADEVFFTGTAAEVIPVTMIDKKPIGNGKPGPITQDLIARFKKIIRES